MATGARIGDLEQFPVSRDGVNISSPDWNFWGVTFATPSNRFFATLLAVEMLVALVVARLPEAARAPSVADAVTSIRFVLLLLTAASLVVLGAGRWSMDARLRRASRQRR